MQDRFATWGETDKKESVLLAILFDEKEMIAKIYVYPKSSLNKDQIKLIKEDWNSGSEIELPEPKEILDRSLSEDSILPEHLLIQETGKLRRLQNEWAYYILSNKLWQSFLDELEALKEKAAAMKAYDADIFEQSKSLWERLLSQKRDKNISQEKLDSIKDDLNGVFDKLKELRKEQIKQLDQESIKRLEVYSSKLDEVKKDLASENANYKSIFDSLKKIQFEIKGVKIRKSHKQELFNTLSELFDQVNNKRREYGHEKIQKRLRGLQEVISKMERSIERDKKDLAYQNRRSEHPGTSQLEEQLRQAKINLIEDKIKSKESKLNDILNTYEQLKKKEKPPINKEDNKKTDSKELKKISKDKKTDSGQAKSEDPAVSNNKENEQSQTADEKTEVSSADNDKNLPGDAKDPVNK